jgi:hypothetical protein
MMKQESALQFPNKAIMSARADLSSRTVVAA